MNEHLQRVLDGSTNRDLWLAISEQRTADALDRLSTEFAVAKRPRWNIWPKPQPLDPDPIRKVVIILLSDPAVTGLSIPATPLENADKLFTE